MKKQFPQVIIQWYKINHRKLPWREENNPYYIWLSEIILQQTRVNQGLPYYNKFITNYPKIKFLAQAEEKEVLKLWEGLGYYSRARNLHETAKKIVSEYKGQFPENYEGLLKLKGVGKYTASAIASFAYNEKVAVVDGNVYRVLSRVFGIKTDISSNQGQKEFSALANKLLPEKDSSIYNQGIMEFGALHCTPMLPKCETCPFEDSCYARKNSLQNVLPVKSKLIVKKKRYFNYFVFKYENNFLMRERKGKDIWQGLYEFYPKEGSKILDFQSAMKDLPKKVKTKNMVLVHESKTYKHILTHQTIFAKFLVFDLPDKASLKTLAKDLETGCFNLTEFDSLPKPVLITNFLRDYKIS